MLLFAMNNKSDPFLMKDEIHDLSVDGDSDTTPKPMLPAAETLS